MINIQDFRKKTIEELQQELTKTLKELEQANLNLLQKKEKNVKKAGQLKKTIAQIKTLLTEKQILSKDLK